MNPIRNIALDLIDPPNSPLRSGMDGEALAELAQSIRSLGLISPLVVRPEGERFRVVAGHRRYLALRMIQAVHIPCVMASGAGEADNLIQLDENTKREQLSFWDEALHLERLQKQMLGTTRDLALLVNHSESWVQSRLDLLLYPPDIAEAVKCKAIGLGVAGQLALITDADERRRLLHYAVEDGVSANVARYWVQQWRSGTPPELTQDLSVISKGNLQPGGEFHYPCKTCGDPTPMSQISNIMVCSGCLKILSEVQHDQPH